MYAAQPRRRVPEQLCVVFRAAAPSFATQDALERAQHPVAPWQGHRIARPWRGRSIREAVVLNPGRLASRRCHSLLLTCPRCGLSISPKVHWLAIEHCPRCLAHAHVAVTLISWPPTGEDVWHEPRPAPRADRPGIRAAERSTPR